MCMCYIMHSNSLISFLQIPFPHSCLSVLFCDTLSLTRAACVNMDLELPTELGGLTNPCMAEDNGFPLSQNVSIVNSSAGMGKAREVS